MHKIKLHGPICMCGGNNVSIASTSSGYRYLVAHSCSVSFNKAITYAFDDVFDAVSALEALKNGKGEEYLLPVYRRQELLTLRELLTLLQDWAAKKGVTTRFIDYIPSRGWKQLVGSRRGIINGVVNRTKDEVVASLEKLHFISSDMLTYQIIDNHIMWGITH